MMWRGMAWRDLYAARVVRAADDARDAVVERVVAVVRAAVRVAGAGGYYLVVKRPHPYAARHYSPAVRVDAPPAAQAARVVRREARASAPHARDVLPRRAGGGLRGGGASARERA